MSAKNIHLDISGMTCVNCSNGITKVVSKMEGLEEVNVNFSSSSGEFVINDKTLTKEKLIAKIQKLGYGVQESQEALAAAQIEAYKSLRRLFISSVVLTLAIFYFMFFPLETNNQYLVFTLATLVQFYPGFRFYNLAYKALSNRNYDMNVLVALGTSAAYFYSSFVIFIPTIFPEHLRFVYFDGAAVIITFILLGKLLEESSKTKATNYLKGLMNLSPKYALRFTENGTTQKILAASLNIGDLVLIKQGEKVTTDAKIIEGSADINAAMITGESMPVFKQEGDQVFAGTINTNGLLKVEVLKPANDTTLANIIKLINQAQGQSIPIARYADKVANIFVPTVIGLSLTTFLVWFLFVGDTMSAILAAISVLIISCPCALGLATPIAIVTAVGKGAKEGILIKNPEILEIIQEIKYAVFDKTGTLTKGEISVKTSTLDQSTLSMVAQIEAQSEHPISHAIVNFATKKGLKSEKSITNFKQITGKGLSAICADQHILIGTQALLSEHNIEFTNTILEEFNEALHSGNGAVLVSVDKKAVGYIIIEDSLKEGVIELINDLKAKNIIPVLLSGDNTITANKLAQKVGITEVYADVLPDQKFEVIKNLQKEAKVMFIGDGVNDSPSIKQADIGIAMSSGADISKDAGDIILINNDVKAINKSINLSIKAMGTIKQNLFFAFIYNAIGIPLAMGVFYPLLGVMLTPMYAGIAMSFSSVSVVLNSLRLKIVKL